MRIPIREQLAALLLISSLIGLGVVSIATWTVMRSFLLSLRATRLASFASLKASELSSNLDLMVNSVQFVSSRVLIQEALQRYNDDGNNTAENWAASIGDIAATLNGPAAGIATGQAVLLQSQIFPRNATGPAGSAAVLNATGAAILGQIQLPYAYPNGTDVYLGDEGLGYPPNLYPNFTYSTNTLNGDAEAIYLGDVLSPSSDPSENILILGPWQVNETMSLISITIPMINNTSYTDALGWLTVVLDATLITRVIYAAEGLDTTGEMLVVGPVNMTNQYPPHVTADSDPVQSVINQQLVEFVMPLRASEASRHPNRTVGTPNPPFNITSYSAVVDAVQSNSTSANPGCHIATYNEAGIPISAGYAMLTLSYIDWVVIVEEARSEVWAPIVRLRNILLACVFGTIGALCLVAWPLAHFASKPIRQLRAATLKTVTPPGFSESRSSFDGLSMADDLDDDAVDGAVVEVSRRREVAAQREGFSEKIRSWRRGKRKTREERAEEARRRQFRIPGKVHERKHLIKDELSDLTATFNEMSDELMMQYERLEERVRLRTAELETSKKAAEAANESKTLFIANISHELKTPLNGILGMCAVCMQEDDPIRLKRSLGIIYKSGDLLLNLLTDLLTFSKNQVGQQLSLDEKDFRLRDISSQITAIFEKQARESQIDLRIAYQSGDDEATIEDSSTGDRPSVYPLALGRIKDMILWGDTHRILQVVINLISNSLKFTPPGGSVILTVRCLGDAPELGSRKSSMISKASKQSKRHSSRHRYSDTSAINGGKNGSADGEKGGAFARVLEIERSTPPPGRTLLFEFDVTDTGPGIPENLHQRIFEPFVQGDLGLSKKYGGTGLGLSICSQLAGLMHGSMHIQSEVGKGSKFTMRIPLRHLMTRADSTASSSVDVASEGRAGPSSSNGLEGFDNTISPPGSAPGTPRVEDAKFEDRQPRLVGLSQPFFASNQPMESPGSQNAAMHQITAAAESSGKIRVLVAEDNKVNQEVVLRMLKLEDIYDVTVAKDGQEALDLVKESMQTSQDNPGSPHAGKGPFNLIFMDVQMPNLDGLQSTKLIREAGYDAPIVALTAFAEESNVKDCLESGMNYFLSKPIRRPALKKVLKEYCAPIAEVDEEKVAQNEATAKSSSAAPAKEPPSTINAKDGTKSSPSTPAMNQSTGFSSDHQSHGRRGSGIDLATSSPNTTLVVVSRPGSADYTDPRRSIESPTKRS